jgi:hypothetical protein
MSETIAQPFEVIEILGNRANIKEIQSAMERIEFHLFSDDVQENFLSDSEDYTDFEYEITYEQGPGEDLGRKSLNLHLTIDWKARTIYQTLGVNLGDGFERGLNANDDGRDFSIQLKEEIQSNVGKTFEEMQIALQKDRVMSEVLEASRALNTVFSRSY